ncbi:RAP protein, putative [Plasmodium sp. gorilla clade G2]|uniref:RAP protein, putative n=1 Tax=Plasmodium sp. gorilla clade G2 TaxID=880535 RepID=UPI000D21FA00|nr:RAP protein, putative [Plasmodium sp. gorilla clade G2]SOV12698.1 RAP protein, putative [Plasmodium sp. gorilla clade G2]
MLTSGRALIFHRHCYYPILFNIRYKCNLNIKKRNNNFLKNISNKNVIYNMDCIHLIENMKYVNENNVNKNIILLYIERLKCVNDMWNVNKIYFIFKTLIKYNIYDMILLKKIENNIININMVDDIKKDCYENIYIIRISYVLYAFYYFLNDNINLQVVEKLIYMLNKKIDYIIYHKDFFNEFILFHIRKYDEQNKNVPYKKDTSSNVLLEDIKVDMNNVINNVSSISNKMLNNVHDNITQQPFIFQFDKNHSKDVCVRNINFYEIYLTLITLKKLGYNKNDEVINKLKFLFYFNCINLDNKISENDMKYITLLFNLFYEDTDLYLLSIVKYVLLKKKKIISPQTDENKNVGSIHDMALIMLTYYNKKKKKKGENSKYEEEHNQKNMMQNKIRENDYVKDGCSIKNNILEEKNYDIKNNIINIIDNISYLSEYEKKNFKYMLSYIKSKYDKTYDLKNIIYNNVLHLLYEKYEYNINMDEKDQINEEEQEEKEKKKNIYYENIIEDLQSLSELIKIYNSYLKYDIDILYYIYIKKYIEYCNIETIMNIFQAYIFVYNINNENNKNYNYIISSDGVQNMNENKKENTKEKKNNININNNDNNNDNNFSHVPINIHNNLTNLNNIVIQIISSKSLYRLYHMCNIKQLSHILYYLYQINNIIENNIYEELYINKLYNHIKNIILIRLKYFLNNEQNNRNMNKFNVDHKEEVIKSVHIQYNNLVAEKNVNTFSNDYRYYNKTSYNNITYNKDDNFYNNGRMYDILSYEEMRIPKNEKLEKKKEFYEHKNMYRFKYTNDIINSIILLFNIFSKKSDSKNISSMILKILKKSNYDERHYPCSTYINILNSFAKLRYRNISMIHILLLKIKENIDTLHFFEYTNLIISLSKLNIVDTFFNIKDNNLFNIYHNTIKDNNKDNINNIFLNEYKDNEIDGLNYIKVINNLYDILKKIDEKLSYVSFVPSYKMIHIISNVLNSYILLGFDKIHFKNINKMIECLHNYIFQYFNNNELHKCDGSNEMYFMNKQEYIDTKIHINDDLNDAYPINNNNNNNTNYFFDKNQFWYFSDKNDIIITKKREGGEEENKDIEQKDQNKFEEKKKKKKKLYLPVQSLYQIYLFYIYFNIYVKDLFTCYIKKCSDEKKGVSKEHKEMIDIKNGYNNTINNIDNNISYNYSSFHTLYSPYMFEKKRKTNNQNIFDGSLYKILSESSIYLLNNIFFFVKYINNFLHKACYEKYNFFFPFLNDYIKNEKKNEDLIEKVKGCDVHYSEYNKNASSSSFHRDVFITLRALDFKNMECEVPFLDGIYTIDIVIGSKICIEINGHNHYYYNKDMKRCYDKIEAQNLIKYYLLSQKYKLILVNYFEWVNLSTVEEKKEFLMKKIKSTNMF